METNGTQYGQTSDQQTDPSGEIVFDTTSGISLEEQQEILAGINAMAGGSRLVTAAPLVKAKKRGILFPLIVNIGALFLLGLGFALILFFYGNDEQEIRESSAALGLTERKLIQEIRQETYRQIREKESQINDILSKLSAVDAEYHTLQGSVETLTETNQERASYLLSMQEQYRYTLSELEEQKVHILEDSRLREAELRYQAEEKVMQLSQEIEQSQASLGLAMEELRRLSTEQERIAMIEKQMGGYYLKENSLINAGRLDEASATLETMKEFLEAASVQGIRSMEARKQIHLAAIAALEGAVAEARRLRNEAAKAPVQTLSQDQDEARVQAFEELQMQYNALEQKVADQEQVIAATNATGSEQSRIIAGFEATINELRTQNNGLSAANANQQQTLNRRDSDIQTLRTENAAREQEMAELNRNMTALQAQLQTANGRLSENEAAVASLRTQVQTANTRIQQRETELEEQRRQNTTLAQQNEGLRQQNETLQSNNEELRSIGEQMRRLLGQ